jgi:hypothetical protein
MTDPKHNPNKNGNARITHHIVKNYDENGIFYQHGCGCEFFKSCFECGFPDCQWNESKMKYREVNCART